MKNLKGIIEHAIDGMHEIQIDQCKSDLHHKLFNEDYFIVGYHAASEWLKDHDIGEFEAVQYVMEKEEEIFGEVNLKCEDVNSEKIVNLFAYFKGQELIYDLESYQSSDESMTQENIDDIINELEKL
jgi:hypothetical protein